MSEQVVHTVASAGIADILERILDKGLVIVGDIKVNLTDIELLTIKIRLLIASVERAKEIGIDWWENDPDLSSRAKRIPACPAGGEEENRFLKERLNRLEARSKKSGSAEVRKNGRGRRGGDEPWGQPG